MVSASAIAFGVSERTDGFASEVDAVGPVRAFEAPTWAPNGRVLMFFRQGRTRADGTGGKTRLWSVDLTGENKREIVTPIDASDPAWSPLNR